MLAHHFEKLSGLLIPTASLSDFDPYGSYRLIIYIVSLRYPSSLPNCLLYSRMDTQIRRVVKKVVAGRWNLLFPGIVSSAPSTMKASHHGVASVGL